MGQMPGQGNPLPNPAAAGAGAISGIGHIVRGAVDAAQADAEKAAAEAGANSNDAVTTLSALPPIPGAGDSLPLPSGADDAPQVRTHVLSSPIHLHVHSKITLPKRTGAQKFCVEQFGMLKPKDS
jgi:hypothetical protein